MEPIKFGLRPVFCDINNPYMPTMISIITSRQCARISIEDIEMVEQVGRVVHIVTADKDYSVYEYIDTIASYLEGRGFYRALNSIIINFDHVKDMEDFYIYFRSGQCATMGRNAFNKTRSAYRKYLQEYPRYMVWDNSIKVAEKGKKS